MFPTKDVKWAILPSDTSHRGKNKVILNVQIVPQINQMPNGKIYMIAEVKKDIKEEEDVLIERLIFAASGTYSEWAPYVWLLNKWMK